MSTAHKNGFLDPFDKDEKFWLVHNIIQLHPLSEGLKTVKNFLENTRELVVFDVEHFQQGDWTTEVHQEFQKILEDAFGEYLLLPKAEDMSAFDFPLSDVWKDSTKGGKILIIYEVIENLRNLRLA